MSTNKWGWAAGALVALMIAGSARNAAATAKTFNGGSANWGTNGSWTPNGVPAAGDDVTISTGTCALNANTNTLNSLTISGGTLTAGSGKTISTGSFTVSSGTFTGNSGSITVTGALSISATGNFTASSATTSVGGSFSKSGTGTFSANTGTVSLTGSGSVGSNGNFVNLTVAGTGTYNATTALTTTSTLTVSSGTLSVGANNLSPASLSISGGTLTVGANTTTVTGTVTLTSGTYTASSGTTNVGGSFTRSGGTFAGNGGTVTMTGSGTITSAGASFNALTIASSGTYTLADQLTTSAGLTISSGTLSTSTSSYATSVGGTFSQTGGTFTANASKLTVTGAFSHTAGTFTAGTSTLALNGTGTLSHTFGGVTLNRVIIGTDQGLVGYWKLDETSGATIADSSGYGNNGTVVGGFGRTTPPSAITFTDPEAMSFDGTAYSTLGVTGMPANNAPQTMSVWIYLNSNTNPPVQNFMALINPTGTTNAAQIGIRNDGYCPVSPCLDVWEFGGTSLAYTTIPSAGSWHHVAYTYDGTTSKVYLDGGLGTTTGNATQSATPLYVYLGSYNGVNEFLNGALDDARVYNRALSAAEITRLATGQDLSYGTGGTHTFSDAFVASDDLLINTGTLTGTQSLSIGGSWINNGGTFTGTGTVSMTGTIAGGAILSNGSSFAALNISGSGGTYSVTDPLVVTGALTISSGATLAGSATIKVGGNWANSGTFNGTGTVTLTGSGTLKSNGSRFAALNVAASGTYTASDRLWVPGGTLTLTSGTLAAATFTARAGSFSLGSGSFTYGGTLIIDGGTTTQSLPFTSFGGALRLEDLTENNLVAYWKLDAGAGNQIYDFSGNGNNGTLSATGTSWQTTVPLTTYGFENPYSLVLNGASGTGAIPAAASIPDTNAAQTVSFWMNPTSVSGTQDVVVFDNTITGDGIKIGMQSSKVTVWTYNAGTVLIQGSTTLTAGTWYHVSYTYDGAGNQGLTVTPVSSGAPGTTVSTTASATNPAITPSYAYFGTNSPSNGELYNGALDEVRVYNVVLTSAQIAQLRLGRYAGTGGTTPTYTASGSTTLTGQLYDDNVIFDGTGQTVNANGGMTVNPGGTLTLGASSVLAIGGGQTLTVDGTLNASGSATVKSSGAYTFKVGSSTSVTPTVNISGLTVTGTNGGMQIGAAGTATPTITQFDNVKFSGGTGAQYLLIKSSALSLYSTGCQFDAGQSSGGTTKAVVMIGNSGTTRALFGSTSCATNWQASGGTVCDDAKAKTDDDSNADGIADAPGNGVNFGAVVQFVRAYEKDTAGSVIGFPTAAFDWNTFTYYSTYAAFHNASGGTADVIYVRDESGNPLYSWTVPTAGETITGTPQWITSGSTHYVYVATTQGHVYRLIDNATQTTSGSLTLDASWGTNPYNCSCTISTPLTMDLTNLYWNSTTGGNTFWTLGQSTQSHPTPVALPSTVVSTGLSIASLYGTSLASGTTYAYLGTTGDFLRINVLSQTTVDANSSPGSASIRGRVVVGYSKQGTYRVYGGDDAGNMWALDATTGFTTTNGLWKYAGGSAINSSPYYDHDTDTIQFGTDGGSIVSLNASTGAAVNTAYPYTPSAGDKITTAPLYYNGVLVFGTTGGKLYFLDRNKGATPWVGIIKEYTFGSSEAVSGIGFDSSLNRYMVTTANSSTNDGHLYYFDLVADPTSGTL
jgi:hypothetical protein